MKNRERPNDQSSSKVMARCVLGGYASRYEFNVLKRMKEIGLPECVLEDLIDRGYLERRTFGVRVYIFQT